MKAIPSNIPTRVVAVSCSHAACRGDNVEQARYRLAHKTGYGGDAPEYLPLLKCLLHCFAWQSARSVQREWSLLLHLHAIKCSCQTMAWQNQVHWYGRIRCKRQLLIHSTHVAALANHVTCDGTSNAAKTSQRQEKRGENW